MLPPPAPTVCTSTIGRASARPPTSRPPVPSTRPSRATDTSHDVPPMSRQTAPTAPASPASRPAPTAPPAGPDSTVHEPCRAAVPASATPPPESITSGAGRPAGPARAVELPLGRGQAGVAGALGQPLEVAPQQGGEGGVHDRRRAALVLAE